MAAFGMQGHSSAAFQSYGSAVGWAKRSVPTMGRSGDAYRV